jgi:hypothetical protein
MSAASRKAGTHGVNRTKEWLTKKGYVWADMEIKSWVDPNRGKEADIAAGRVQARPMFATKRDQFGCDLLATDGKVWVAIQVKTNPGDMSRGRRDLCSHPFPPGTQRWVVRWEPKAHDPVILDCTSLPTITIAEALAAQRILKEQKRQARKQVATPTTLF